MALSQLFGVLILSLAACAVNGLDDTLIGEIQDLLNLIMSDAEIYAQEVANGGPLSPASLALESVFGQSTLGPTSAQAQMFALEEISIQFGLSAEDMHALYDHLTPMLYDNTYVFSEDDDAMPTPGISQCPYPRGQNCEFSRKYRPYNGMCNSKFGNPLWAASRTPFARCTKQVSYDDGIMSPRTRAFLGGFLPSPRLVSIAIAVNNSVTGSASLMLMTYGQFVDHDLTLTPGTKILDANGHLVEPDCGSNGCKDASDGPEFRYCDPIPVAGDDPDFSSECLTFVRSKLNVRMDCRPGPMEHINLITGYHDGSNIYGSSRAQRDRLRVNQTGFLNVTAHPNITGARPLLPKSGEAGGFFCRGNTSVVGCFESGDVRVNEQPGLTALHTTFHRYHNVIAEQLLKLNTEWSGHKVFEEARRIIIAVMQIITYKEFLPLIVGPELMETHMLSLNTKSGHHCTSYYAMTDPSICNEFAAGAYRFGHSLIQGIIPYCNRLGVCESVPITETFFNPTKIYASAEDIIGESGIESIILGQVSTPAQSFDNGMVDEITRSLFTEHPPHGIGTDLFSLNVKRGREHGLPSYLDMRRFYNLPVPESGSFSDLTDITPDKQALLASVYDHVEDIDMFAGGLCETSMAGAVVGRLFGRVIAQQFIRIKKGDRFFHEFPWEESSFTSAQLNSIRPITLADVLCEVVQEPAPLGNGTPMKMQPFAFLLPLSEVEAAGISREEAIAFSSFYELDDNERIDCSLMHSLDLTAFKEGVFEP